MTDHSVHEAVGPPLTGLQAAGSIGVGVNSLLIAGLFPALLGALGEEHRLSASGLGLAATIELLAMGITTGLAGMALKPARLRLIGVITSLLLAALDLATTRASGGLLMAIRGGAGAAEGILLWITVGMIARTVTPERWAAVFFTAQTIGQLLLAIAFAVVVIPRFGANGGYVCLALCSLLGVAPALVGMDRYAPLVAGHDEAGPPPLRGWIALIGTVIFVSSSGAVSIYLEPFAIQAGLSPDVARTAVWVSLAAQVGGGMAATAMAGRVNYFHVFVAGAALSLAAWACFGFAVPALVFIGANAVAGIVSLIIGAFLVPMTIEADPSRRAAMQSGGAQLLGGALGPLLASRLVSEKDAHAVLWLGDAMLLGGLAVIAWLHLTAHRATPAA